MISHTRSTVLYVVTQQSASRINLKTTTTIVVPTYNYLAVVVLGFRWQSILNIHTYNILVFSFNGTSEPLKKDLGLCERYFGTFPHSQSIHKYCGAGQAVAWKQALSFLSDHLHTWVLFATLASISVLLQHCLEHGKMVGIVFVWSLGGEIHQKSLSLTDTTKCILSPLVQQCGNDPLTSNGHKKKWISDKKRGFFPHFILLSWHLSGIFPTAFSVLQVISGCMERMLWFVNREVAPFLSLIGVPDWGF